MTKLVSRRDVFENARSWVGVPYKHMGYDRKGVDCVGLLTGVALEMQLIAQPPQLLYARDPSPAYFKEQAHIHLVPVSRTPDNLALGDVATFFGSEKCGPQHFAIIGELYGEKTMIHAISKYGKVVEHQWESFWGKRFISAFEFRNVEPL